MNLRFIAITFSSTQSRITRHNWKTASSILKFISIQQLYRLVHLPWCFLDNEIYLFVFLMALRKNNTLLVYSLMSHFFYSVNYCTHTPIFFENLVYLSRSFSFLPESVIPMSKKNRRSFRFYSLLTIKKNICLSFSSHHLNNLMKASYGTFSNFVSSVERI